MTLTTHPTGADDHFLWGNITITTEQAVEAAASMVRAAYRTYKIGSIAEVSGAKKQEILDGIYKAICALGIKEFVTEWWQDFEETA